MKKTGRPKTGHERACKGNVVIRSAEEGSVGYCRKCHLPASPHEKVCGRRLVFHRSDDKNRPWFVTVDGHYAILDHGHSRSGRLVIPYRGPKEILAFQIRSGRKEKKRAREALLA